MPAKRGNKAAFLGAFRTSGDISKASKIAGVERGVHYRWLGKDPEYKTAFDAVCAEIAVKRVARSQKAASQRIEDELRAEMKRLRESMREMGKKLRKRIAELEAKVSNAAARPRQQKQPGADPEPDLLDQIARGMGKKPFSKLAPAHQEAVRQIAARINGEQPD